MPDLPRLSVILASLNEEAFIESALRSILDGNYPAEKLEVIAVDGESTDQTREILTTLQREYGSSLKVFENHRRITPCAFNIGVEASSGDVIAIVNGHSIYDPDYFRRCVMTLIEQDADLVGGLMLPTARSRSALGRGIEASLAHPFGVGNAAYRIGASEPVVVDTVGYGCYRRDVFDRIGRYDVRLKHSQDMDLNMRLKAAGGKILLDPRATCHYRARSSFDHFVWHNFRNGRWVSIPVRLTRTRFPWRHFVPGIFVTVLCASGILALFSRRFRFLFGFTVGSYLVGAMGAATDIAWRSKDPRYLVVMPFVFASLHLPYGIGSLLGLIEPVGKYRRDSKEG